MARHEPCNKTEAFLGNVDISVPKDSRYRTLKTLRVGTQAYDIAGNPIPSSYMRPLFINIAEINKHDQIHMSISSEIFKGTYNSANKDFYLVER